MKNMAYTILLGLLLSACGPETETESDTQKQVRQLNVSVLIDLSDRINQTGPDSTGFRQFERDTAIIRHIVSLFKESLNSPGNVTFTTKAKLKIFFHPEPDDPRMTGICENLQIDMGPLSVQEKKKNYKKMDSLFAANLSALYNISGKSGKYPGSDIWGFMKDEVKSKCIEDSNYRNVLLILTDGYLYWDFNRFNGSKHRYSYITQKSEHLTRFRKKQDWAALFQNDDYGFITTRNDLRNLEVLVIGIAPPVESPRDYEILKAYWSKWLTEMNVSRFDILKTDQPINTRKALNDFFSYPRKD